MLALENPRPFTKRRKVLLRLLGVSALTYSALPALLERTPLQRFPAAETLNHDAPFFSLILALVAGVFLLFANGLNEHLHRRTYSLRLRAKRTRRKMQSGGAGLIAAWWREEGRFRLNYIVDPRGSVALWTLGGAAAVLLAFALAATDLSSDQDDLAAGAWQAYAAFAAAALPILVFVIEIAKGDRTIASTTTEVLIRESRVFPILVLVLAAALVFAAPQLPTLLALAVFAVGVASVAYAYGKTLHLLVNRNQLRRGEVELIRERVEADVRATLEERIAFNLLRRFMEENGGELNPFASGISSALTRRSTTAVFPPDRGVLHDINLFLLQDLLNALPQGQGTEPAEGAGTRFTPQPAGPAEDKVLTQVLTPLEHEVAPDRPLLRVPAEVAQATPSIEKSVQAIFSIRRPEQGRQDPLRENLTDIRRGIIRAIRQRDPTEVDQGLDLYRDVLRAFLSLLQEHGVRYNRSNAASEGTLFTLGEWRALEWLKEGARSLLFEAFDHPHRDVIRSVLYLPISLANIGLEEGDYLAFHRFVRHFYAHAYHLALQVDDASVKELAVDRIWRFPKEFMDMRLGYHLRGRPEPHHVEAVVEHAEGVILIYNDLLKAAFDEDELEDFGRFAALLQQVGGEDLGKRVVGYEDWARRKRYGREEDPHEKSPVYEHMWEMSGRLDRLKRITAFGLQAWVIRQYRRQELAADEINKWYDPLQIGGSLLHKGEALLAAWVDTGYEDLLRWSWWEMEGVDLPQPMAVRLTYDSDLKLAYVLQALQSASTSEINSGDFPESRDFEVLVSEDGELRKILQEVEPDPSKWSPLVPDAFALAADRLSRAWDEYLQQREQSHRLAVIEAEVDDAAVQAFRDDVLSGFRRAAGLLEVLRAAGSVDSSSMRGEEAPDPVGFYQLLEKRFFVSFNRVHVAGWDGYGNEIVRTLTSLAITRIAETVHCTRPGADDSSGLNAISRALTDLREKGYKDPVIIVSGSWSVTSAMWERQPEFVPAASGRTPEGQIGTWHGAPVYTYPAGPQSLVLVADLCRLGTLKLYQASEEERGEMLLDTMRFCVQPISEAEASRMVEKNPEVYRKRSETQDELTVEAAVMELRSRVRFELDVSAEFLMEDRAAAVCVNLLEEES